MLLATRFGRPGAIIAGVGVAALGNALVSAYAGSLLHGMIGDRALALFTALSLVTLALAGFWPQKTEDTGGSARSRPARSPSSSSNSATRPSS